MAHGDPRASSSRASASFPRVLRSRRPADALAAAMLAARNLEAVGGVPAGSPGGVRATAARDAAREANADALCARLRAEAMEALTRLDRFAEAKSHAVAAEKDADAAGDVDASRRAAFVRARADAKRGAVDAALAAYAALLLDMAESPRDVAAPAPDVSFRASTARRYARLATRRDPSSDAATLALDDAVADVREFAFRLGLDDALAYPDELRNVYNPAWARWRDAASRRGATARAAGEAPARYRRGGDACGAHTYEHGREDTRARRVTRARRATRRGARRTRPRER